MDQTPLHEVCNVNLLECMPPQSKKIVELGCMSGALAREFKKINPDCHYFGIDIEPKYTELAKRYCDRVDSFDIEVKDDYFFESLADADCWVFGDVLEHLKDPWRFLKKIRGVIPQSGCVVACIPNAQNWSIIAKLCIGDFRYEDQGLLDRTHLRWFTRQTIAELFRDTGFKVEVLNSRSFGEPEISHQIYPLIGELAKRCGANPDLAIADAKVFQFLIRAVPVTSAN
jgi:SAM-dependent methyltransferase